MTKPPKFTYLPTYLPNKYPLPTYQAVSLFFLLFFSNPPLPPGFSEHYIGSSETDENCNDAARISDGSDGTVGDILAFKRRGKR